MMLQYSRSITRPATLRWSEWLLLGLTFAGPSSWLALSHLYHRLLNIPPRMDEWPLWSESLLWILCKAPLVLLIGGGLVGATLAGVNWRCGLRSRVVFLLHGVLCLVCGVFLYR
jgi:hypothetical protein